VPAGVGILTSPRLSAAALEFPRRTRGSPLAEAATVLKKFLGGKGVDEIRPEMLKVLDIVGLS